MTFVVVGGGPTGVEVAGQIGESRRTLTGAIPVDRSRREARIILVEAAPAVLPVYGAAS